MSPSRSHTTAVRVSGQARDSSSARPNPSIQRPLSGASLPRKPASMESTPSGRPSSLAARQKWAAIPAVPLPPPPRSASPSVHSSPL